MKNLVSVLLILSLLLAPSLAAAAEDAPGVAADGVVVTATGYSAEPGADGAARLTVWLRAENTGAGARELRCLSCLVGSCELPACLSLRLEAGESRDTALVVPLTALGFFDLTAGRMDFLRLRLSVSRPEEAALPVFSDSLLLRVDALPLLSEREVSGQELFSRFGARVRSLGADCDGLYLTAWLLLENNNDFPLRLEDNRTEGESPRRSFLGGTVQAHSRAAFRVDLPLDKKPSAVSFDLSLALSAYADGEGRDPVPMGTLTLPLRLEERSEGDWTLSPGGEAEALYEQSYFARVGMREFSYNDCLPVLEPDLSLAPLRERESGLTSLACCAGYEVLAGAERARAEGASEAELPLTLRSFTGEALSLSLKPDPGELWLPCLTADTLRAEANGGAEALWIFDAGGLAYTERAEETAPSHGFRLLVGPAEDPSRLYGVYPRQLICAARLPEAAEPCALEELSLGALRLRVLGLELTDGFSLWLELKNDGDSELVFGPSRVDAMLNSGMLSLYNSAARVPARSDCLVLLRGAQYAEADGSPDPFAFRAPPLTELNTLKLRLGPEDAPETLSIMFRTNGHILFASVL